MPSVPVSLFGFLGFLILTGFLFSAWFGSDPDSALNKVSEDTKEQITYIQSIQANGSTDWLSGIANTANIVGASFTIALNYISMPLGFTVESVATIVQLPTDLAPIVTVVLFVALIAAVAIFIRRG